MPLSTLKMKWFNSPEACLRYILAELEDTLREDYRKMRDEEREHYTENDRREMARRIKDCTALAPYVTLTERPNP